MRDRKKIIYIVSLLIFILGILNWRIPIIRFEYSILNQAFIFFLLLIPAELIVLNFILFKNFFVRILLSVVLVIPCMVGLLLSLFVFANIINTGARGYDASFEQIHKINMDNYQVSIYRTNGGATTSFGIIIRQEKVILPAILLVKEFYNAYPKDDVDYSIINRNTLLIDGKEYYLENNIYSI